MYRKLKSAAALPGFALLLHFTDGSARRYDMSGLIRDVPAFAPLASPELFSSVHVDPGGYGLSWNDEIDIDAAELYENGEPVSTAFDGLMSFAEATSLWGLSESALRKAVSYNRLVEGVDAQKFGKQWIVTRSAMEREYGAPPLT